MSTVPAGTGGAVGRAFRWWGAGLKAALPVWLARSLCGDDRMVVIRVEDGRVVAWRIDPADDSAAPVGAARRDEPRTLVPPPGLVLHRRVTLPAAAVKRLDRAAALGLERWTAFRPHEVYHLARPAGPGRQGQVAIDLYLIPKPAAAGLLAACAAAGHPVSHIRLGPGIGDQVACDPRVARRLARGRLMDRCLLLLLPVAMLFALATVSGEIARTHEALREAIATGVRDQRRLASLAAEAAAIDRPVRALAADEAQRLPVRAVLAELGRYLPEPAGIVQVTWDGTQGVLVLDDGAAGPVPDGRGVLDLRPDGPNRWHLRFQGGRS